MLTREQALSLADSGVEALPAYEWLLSEADK